MSLEQKSKKDLIEIIREMKDKLSEVRKIESQVITESKDLTTPGVGLIKDLAGNYSMVKLKYDVEKNAAVIESVTKFDTQDEAIVVYTLNKYVGETIIRKARGGKYDK